MSFFKNLLGLFTGGAAAGIPADKQNYVGQWSGDGVELSVGADGEVRFRESHTVHTEDGTSTKARSVSGPIARWEGNGFVVGTMGSETPFRVDAPPGVGGTMTVNGVALTRRG